MICTACWEADIDTCDSCSRSIIEQDREYAEEELQQERVVDLVDDDGEAISASLEAIVDEFNNFMEPDNSSFGLETATNGGVSQPPVPRWQSYHHD